MNKYNIPIENVLRHYDVTHKICPEPYIDNGIWGNFKNGILSLMSSPQPPTVKIEPVVESVTIDKTIDDVYIAVSELNKRGLMLDTNLWVGLLPSVKYLDQLLINMANYCINKEDGKGNLANLWDALKILHEKGIINSPEYWQNTAGGVNNLDLLLIKIANYAYG